MEFLPSDPLIIIIAVLSVLIALLVIFVVLVVTYKFLSRWLKFLEKERTKDEEAIKAKAYKQAYNIMEDAKQKSLKLLEEANIKAQDTIGAAKAFSDESKKTMQDELQKVTQSQISALHSTSGEILNSYKDIIEQQKRESITQLTTISKEMETEAAQSLDELKGVVKEMEGEALKELGELKGVAKEMEDEAAKSLDEFRQALQTETVDSHKKIEEKLVSMFDAVRADLDGYKSTKIKEIDESINELLVKVSKLVLGKVISLEDHQDLVKASLDEAKRELGFGVSEEDISDGTDSQ